MRRTFATIALAFTIAVPGVASADNLVFNFNNPNFGGDPLNGNFLFGLADAQQTATRGDVSAGGGIGGNPTVDQDGTPIVGPTIVIPITTGNPDQPNGQTTVGEGDTGTVN